MDSVIDRKLVRKSICPAEISTMDHANAVAAVKAIRNSYPVKHSVRWVTPILTSVLAASSIRHQNINEKIAFHGNADGYAENNLLLPVISGKYEFPKRSGGQGVSYTKLTRLATHNEVDSCNSVINDLISEQFHDFSPQAAGSLMKIVGELHDNVASHANGTGFSCAQTFNDAGNCRRIQFAVADAGCGMFANVKRVIPSIETDHDAIKWCLKKGNTTARPRSDNWAQRLPEDCQINPYPDTVSTFVNEDHHIGEGLWQLKELVRQLNGGLWVWSGFGEYCYNSDKEESKDCRIDWQGVALEFEFTIPAGGQATPEQQDGLEALARRIGL